MGRSVTGTDALISAIMGGSPADLGVPIPPNILAVDIREVSVFESFESFESFASFRKLSEKFRGRPNGS
jgi:hypothetical protein